MGSIRLILAISVVLAHSGAIFGLSFVGGQIAVQSFYIISGFYMSLILNEKYINENNSYKLFISNRFLRLYPIYWAVLLLTILLSIAASIASGGHSLGKAQAYLTYYDQLSIGSFLFLILTNIGLFLQDTVLFLGLDQITGNLFFTENFRLCKPVVSNFLLVPQAWTIGIELTFYLIAPFIVRRRLSSILLWIVASLSFRIILYYRGLDFDPWTYRFFPTELLFFLLGNVSYRIYCEIKNQDINPVIGRTLLSVLLLFTFSYSKIETSFTIYIYYLLFFISLPFIFKVTKNWKKDAAIGELSFPIYISHLLILSVIQRLNFPAFGSMGLTLTVVTILFSILLNEFIAKRIEKIRQNRVRVNPN